MKVYLLQVNGYTHHAYLDQEKARKALRKEADERYKRGEFFQYVTPDYYSWYSWSRLYYLHIKEVEVIDA